MRHRFLQILFVTLISAFTTPASAETDFYLCRYDDGSVFGENFEFGYDRKRNIILLNQHRKGSYNKNFTLGYVELEGGWLNFHFEEWEDGGIRMRESHNLDLSEKLLTSSQDFYNEKDTLIREGPRAETYCSGVADGGTAVQAPSSALKCHTQTIASKAGKQTGHWCVQSVLPESKDFSYGPENLGSASGAWCEGEAGQGIGVGLEVSFDPSTPTGRPYAFDHLVISNGYDRSTRTFMQNSRIKQIEIRTDDGDSWVRTLRDETGPQKVNLGKIIRPHGILITILDIYPGQKYQDTCLSYLMPGFKAKN